MWISDVKGQPVRDFCYLQISLGPWFRDYEDFIIFFIYIREEGVLGNDWDSADTVLSLKGLSLQFEFD